MTTQNDKKVQQLEEDNKILPQHQLLCRVCDQPGLAKDIADDPNDDEYGTCGECEEEATVPPKLDFTTFIQANTFDCYADYLAYYEKEWADATPDKTFPRRLD